MFKMFKRLFKKEKRFPPQRILKNEVTTNTLKSLVREYEMLPYNVEVDSSCDVNTWLRTLPFSNVEVCMRYLDDVVVKASVSSHLPNGVPYNGMTVNEWMVNDDGYVVSDLRKVIVKLGAVLLQLSNMETTDELTMGYYVRKCPTVFIIMSDLICLIFEIGELQNNEKAE